MPIRIPNDLPARKTLESEGIAVMDSSRATRQDIRPLQVGLLNLMPNKERTETQFARLIGATPLQIELTLVRISDHKSKNTGEDYLNSFYQRWEDVKEQKFDGFIITGAPIAHLPFEEVRYWPEMIEIMDWTQTNVHSTMFICWGVQAALFHFHGIDRKKRKTKAVGVYRHQVLRTNSPYLRGFSDDVAIPVSRSNDIDANTLPKNSGLEVLIDSEEVGICMLNDPKHHALHMLNHLEYDDQSLGDEYTRDVKAGLNPDAPISYYPDDNPDNPPQNRWRSHGFLLFQNWINEFYQTTPFDINKIGQKSE